MRERKQSSASAFEDTRPFPLRDHNETVISSGARAATPSGRSREISRMTNRTEMRLISRLRSLPSGTLTPLEMTVILTASGDEASVTLRHGAPAAHSFDPGRVQGLPGRLGPLEMT